MLRKPVSDAAGASRQQAATKVGQPGDKLPQCKLLLSAVASCLLLGGAPAAFGQSAGSNLRGQVTDEAAPAANTEVVATNLATGAVRRTRTSDDGSYVLVGLQPGTYRVEAGDAVEIVTLSVASNSTLDIDTGDAMETADVDTITVVGQRAEADVLTSEVGAIVSPRLISQLPQATRNFLEFADTVPGVTFTLNPEGEASLSSGSTGTIATNLFIDGVGQKNYVTGGIAGQRATRGSPFPQLAIGQYKVITSNYKAEYGQVAGAALTAVTRSGTNEFEAEAFYRFTNEGLRTTRPDEEAPDEEKVDSQTEEYGFAVGGPIIEDRLHYFLTYSYKDLITPRTVSPDVNASDAVQFLPADVQALFGPHDLPFEEDLVFGKLSWQATDQDLLELSLEYRDEVQVAAVGNRRGPLHGQDATHESQRATLRWERSADNWFNELRFTTEDLKDDSFPNGGLGNGIIYVFLEPRAGDDPLQRQLIQTGPASGFDAKARQQKGWAVADDLTFTGFDWHGDHTFKFGATYRDVELTFSDGGSINPQFFFGVDASGVAATPYQARFLAPGDIPGLRETVVADGEQIGLYAQDDWAVNEHLILNIGIRWDYEKNPAFTDYVTPPGIVAALMADDPENPGVQPWGDRLLASGIDINDYISTGDNREDFKDAWAPRLGFSYDINADEQYVIHGGAGRSYDRNLFADMAFEMIKGELSFTTMNFQDPATGQCVISGAICVPWDPAFLTGGADALAAAIPAAGSAGERFLANNDLKTPYADQYSLGLSSQLSDWLTDVTVQRIHYYDGFVYLLGQRYPNGAFFNETGANPFSQRLPGFGNLILGSNGVETKSTQVLISARKPYDRDSGWGTSLAYTYTDATHNRSPGTLFAFDKPTIDAYPFIRAAVPKHRFVGAGSIDGPWGLTFGGKVVLETPTPINVVRNYGFVAPDNSVSQPVAYTPPATGSFLIGGDIWGYRTVDLQATKVFTVGDYELTARVNLLNAFDYENLNQFNIIDVPQTGVFVPEVEVNEFGNMLYVPRTLSFEVGFRF